MNLEQELFNHLPDRSALEYMLRDGLSIELLYEPRFKSAYQFSQQYYNDTSLAPSPEILGEEFPKVELETPTTHVKWVVDKLRERYQKNKVEKLVVDLANKAGQPNDAMVYLRDQVMEIERASLSTSHIWRPEDYKMFLQGLQQKILEGGYIGASIGFKQIDQFTGGIKPGQLCPILARPKRQKTFLTCNAFIQQARQGFKPVLFTLENSEEEILLRISCMLSGVSWDKAQRGELMKGDYRAFETAWEQFNEEVEDYWIEMPAVDERTVMSMFLKADKLGAESILISQLRYIRGLKDYYRNEYEEPAEVIVDLKRMASRPGKQKPVILEAQFNRGGDTMEELEDFNPSKVGLTDMITQVSDTLYGIFQSKDLRSSGDIEFGILEARNHDKASWYIHTELKNYTEFKLLNQK